MIATETRQRIKGYLEGFVQAIIENQTGNNFAPKELRPARHESEKGDLKPFHESLLASGLLTITEFERSLSTKLGTSFEECARLIALDHHKRAARGHHVSGKISVSALKAIEDAVSTIGSGGIKKLNYPSLVKRIIALAHEGDDQEERRSIADLYIVTNDNVEIFIELKSPKPNKGQCLEATSRILQIYGLRYHKHPKVKSYFATAYNPYGVEKSAYKHSFALNYMDMENEVLIGKEFWDLIGGSGTYEEILGIYQEVGREKCPDILDKLAFGY